MKMIRSPKFKDPVEVLCSQIHANVDVVKAIRRMREGR